MTQHRPTSRHELLRLGDRLDFAERAVTILERKRDALIFEFMDLLDRRRQLRARLSVEYAAARRRLVTALLFEGAIPLRSAAKSRSIHPELLVTEWKLRSERVPMFLSRGIRSSLTDRGYGVVGTSADLDAAVDAHEQLLETVVNVAEMDAVLHRLVAAVGETSRRLNVLRHRLIPNLERERKELRTRLDEREREERIYQRLAKRRREAHRAERRELVDETARDTAHGE